MAKSSKVVEQEVVKSFILVNNTKGLRGVCGHKLLPGKAVEVSREQVAQINKNPVAMAWIECGDLSLK